MVTILKPVVKETTRNGRLDTPVNENHAVFMNLHLSTTIDKLKTDANHAHGQLYKKNASHLI